MNILDNRRISIENDEYDYQLEKEKIITKNIFFLWVSTVNELTTKDKKTYDEFKKTLFTSLKNY